eukprot:COSAG04_NODE_589_length_12295_cov_12.315513_8_plen_203_part_00
MVGGCLRSYDDASADYWLTEISGLALGLPSDMLRYPTMTPMHVRGLAHASTNRWQAISHAAGCTHNISAACDPFDPRDIWSLQRSFGIEASRMVGWWAEVEEGLASLPVRSSDDAVKVTSYVRKGHATLVVLANFGTSSAEVTLTYDWAALGLSASTAKLSAPPLRVPPQPAQHWPLQAKLTVPAPTKGAPDSRDGLILLLQ